MQMFVLGFFVLYKPHFYYCEVGLETLHGGSIIKVRFAVVCCYTMCKALLSSVVGSEQNR